MTSVLIRKRRSKAQGKGENTCEDRQRRDQGAGYSWRSPAARRGDSTDAPLSFPVISLSPEHNVLCLLMERKGSGTKFESLVGSVVLGLWWGSVEFQWEQWWVMSSTHSMTHSRTPTQRHRDVFSLHSERSHRLLLWPPQEANLQRLDFGDIPELNSASVILPTPVIPYYTLEIITPGTGTSIPDISS